MSKSCTIIGGGIAGISAALSLTKIGIQCTVYELRTAPSTIGGSVNLTPNALRLLEYLDVEVEGYGCRVDSIEIFSLHTSKQIGELSCRKFGPSLRILKEELLQALLWAAGKKGISVSYDSKLVSIKDDGHEEKVTAVFANGKAIQADFILGCDGIHSAVRSQYVEPSRELIYTNVAVAYSIVDGRGIETHFQQTAMNSGQLGSLLTAYVDPDRTKIYLGAVMEIPDEKDRQGWKVRGKDRQKTLDEISRRFKASGIPCVNELVERAENIVFYPVYNLGPGGVWSRGRVLLLGDAAHGMPPQGESTGLAIEDSVLFARILSASPEIPIKEEFRVYEKTRRPRIDKAYKEAVMKWEGYKDRRWLVQKLIEWLMWMILWYQMSAYEASISYDVRNEEIVE